MKAEPPPKRLKLYLVAVFILILIIILSFPRIITIENEVSDNKIVIRDEISLGFKYITAYTPRIEETDDTPCISASNLNVCEAEFNVVANNCLTFGERVIILNKVYQVEDRMNKRYGCDWFDILMKDLTEARKFGVQYKEVKLIK